MLFQGLISFTISLFDDYQYSDHAGGNADLVKMMPELSVYGGDERIEKVTQFVNHGDQLKVRSEFLCTGISFLLYSYSKITYCKFLF